MVGSFSFHGVNGGWHGREPTGNKNGNLALCVQLLLRKELWHQNKFTVASKFHDTSCNFMNSLESLRNSLNYLCSRESGDNSFQ